MEDKHWEKLKSKLNDQLADIRKHGGSSGTWSVCGRMYREVLKVMEAIESGRDSELIPFNCCFKTEKEIKFEMTGGD